MQQGKSLQFDAASPGSAERDVLAAWYLLWFYTGWVGKGFLETARLWRHRPAPRPNLVVEVKEGGGVVFLYFVCSFVLCPGAGSVQLYGAAVLLGFFTHVILLTRTHQAVQQVSCSMIHTDCYSVHTMLQRCTGLLCTDNNFLSRGVHKHAGTSFGLLCHF